jgi:hypothetical protein
VIAAGFSLFSEDDNVRPTVTRGIVTRVSDPVAMLQTTCCVQSGASGGALFRCTGDLVGLISCNVMDTCTGALFPRINMAVPASVLTKPLNDYLHTGGKQQCVYLYKPELAEETRGYPPSGPDLIIKQNVQKFTPNTSRCVILTFCTCVVLHWSLYLSITIS